MRWNVMRWLVPLSLYVALSAQAEVRVAVEGADNQLATNVRNHLGAVTDGTLEQPRSLQRQLRQAVNDASRALGYYQANFSYHMVRTGEDATTLTVRLEPGPRLRWAPSKIAVTGPAHELAIVQDQLRAAPFEPDAPATHPTYDAYKQRLLDLLVDYGFLDARYEESRLLLNAEQGTATAVLRLSSGRRYEFGDVSFEGSVLSPALLQRLVPFRPGEPFRRSGLAELYRQLQDSLYFQSLSVTSQPTEAGTVPVEVQLEDAPRHRLSLGAGYGTDTGPRLRLRWERPHLTESGHQLSAEARLSKPLQELEGEYRVPLAAPLWQSITGTASLEARDIEDTESTIASVGLFYTDRIGDFWYTSIGATLENESYRQGNEPRQRVSYLIPAASVTGLDVADVADPLRGHRTWSTLSGSHPSLGADTEFIRFTAGHKRLIHLWGDHLLIARAEIGAISSDQLDLIPASQRFFTGGDQTVRGYDFESISTRNTDGTLRGGRYLNVASLEYSIKVLPQWRVALFSDSGRAFADWDEAWRSSVGVGVRWLSPVGQIRVDLAAQVGDEADGWRIHIFMGPPL